MRLDPRATPEIWNLSEDCVKRKVLLVEVSLVPRDVDVSLGNASFTEPT